MSKIWSALVGENLRVYITDTTELVKDAVKAHDTKPVSTIALGRTLTATSMLGKLLKNEKDVLTVKITGTNQIKGILVTTNYHGDVKGYISNTEASLPFQSSLNEIGEAIGRGGNITLTRDFGLKKPYVGISHMMNAEVDDDIAFYYLNSEQQPTALKTKVILDASEVVAAGGILIQPMPYATAIEKEAYKNAKNKIHDITIRLNGGESPETILKAYFPDLTVQMTGEFPISFKCDCSVERVSKALLTVGREELKEILSVDQQAELKCHFCNKTYHFDKNNLENMIRALND